MTKADLVINAAGKLTSLGGTAQSPSVATSQAAAAGRHVDLAKLRKEAGERLAELTGAEAGCVTTGAAAGITISVAALLCERNPDLLHDLPETNSPFSVLLQAGHAINFGATITQMIRLAGARPEVVGGKSRVTTQDIRSGISPEVVAFLYVKSHHCVQENMVELPEFISLANAASIPVIVDAAAEEDLTIYIAAGADLVTYSGGKAFGGPTSGFIVGRKQYLDWCEAQSEGIARTMKVGKEQIAGLLTALDEYIHRDESARRATLHKTNAMLVSAFEASAVFEVALRPDEAGRPFTRVALTPHKDRKGAAVYDPFALVNFLEAGSPSIRTRNHHLKDGILLIDPRELKPGDVEVIIEKLKQFEAEVLST